MKLFLLLIPLALMLSGCTSVKGLAKELKDDPAIVVLRMGTPWGNQSLTRIGGQTNAISISTDGTIHINAKP